MHSVVYVHRLCDLLVCCLADLIVSTLVARLVCLLLQRG